MVAMVTNMEISHLTTLYL
ncbi:unnamed protein product [Timema podura]|uniref:Uncharacterized protein n=1 Tax=Timema podura TaxID=61482 RepID=A0ABN7P464_TIMPD|nr:unnamed protein product [Timema podura]